MNSSEREEKYAEVTFKYYLPDHADELWIHTNAHKMYSLLFELDQRCRTVVKYEEIEEDSPRYKLAEEIRSMIWNEINLDNVR